MSYFWAVLLVTGILQLGYSEYQRRETSPEIQTSGVLASEDGTPMPYPYPKPTPSPTPSPKPRPKTG